MFESLIQPQAGCRRTPVHRSVTFRHRQPGLAIAGLALVLLTSIALSAASVAAAPRPNIILIMADDMGFSDIGCYGGEIHTPNLDSLARGGMRFTQFYNNAKCTTTRASLLSGMYPRGNGNSIPLNMPTYAAMVDRMDQNIGRVLQTIRDLGIEDNTVVMFLSDNVRSPKNSAGNGTAIAQSAATDGSWCGIP